MELIIRNTANQPIYEQICQQIKAQIISGQLSPGEALPSIRGLAKDLKISVITTKRAYDELEAEGFLTTVAGKGCFVAEKNLDLIRERQLQDLSQDHAFGQMEQLNRRLDQLIGMMEEQGRGKKRSFRSLFH